MRHAGWHYFNNKVWKADGPYYYFKPLTSGDVRELQRNAKSVEGYKEWRRQMGDF